jgi:hypothetical protein
MASALTFALPAASTAKVEKKKDAWDQDPCVRAVIENLLLDQLLHQPKNTMRAYAPK